MEDSYIEVIEQQPEVFEKKIFNLRNLPISLLICFIFIMTFVMLMFFFNPNISTALIIALTFIVVYSIILFFLLEPRLLRQVNQKEIHKHTIDRPVPYEVVKTITRPVEVIKHVPYRVEVPIQTPPEESRTVYVARPIKKLSIPHYDYVGSSEQKVFHKSSCRLGKLIKRKYKLSNNDPGFFKRKGFVPCMSCIQKKVHV